MLTTDIKASFPNLPLDVASLHAVILSLHEKIDKMTEMSQNYELENNLLREKIRYLQYQLYGRKSEKYVLQEDCEQKFLFEDKEAEGPAVKDSSQEEVIIVPEHNRKKKGRKPLPDDIPRVEVIHDLSEKEKVCACGCEMSRIGEESSEKLEIHPPQLLIVRNIRPKYVCKNCEGIESPDGAVKLAPPPAQILPKSIATPSLLAHLFVSKFSDALPFYRQSNQLQRYGIELSRATMCNWTFRIWEKLKILGEVLREELLSGPYLSIDETTVQVLNEPERSSGSKSYMWVFRGGPPGQGIVIYHYSPSRSGEVASDFIGNYPGYVQTDGYVGYDFLDGKDGITHAGCWAHARRKFVEVERLGKKEGNKQTRGKGKCVHALETIRKLYMIERKAQNNNLSPGELYQLRQEESKPILDEFKKWLDENVVKIPPKGKLGEAFNYTINQWPRLKNYLKSGLIPIDNNLTENAIRPFVMGRKNWLFSDQPEGAHASALLYSLIETARANGLEPYSYFLYLFDRFPQAVNEEDYKKLLPINLTQETITEAKKEYWQNLNIEP
jgi:transposase